MRRHIFETAFLWLNATLLVMVTTWAVGCVLYYAVWQYRGKRYHPKLSFFHPAVWFTTVLGVGKAPFAPGTWGSVAGIVVIAAIGVMPKYQWFPSQYLLPVFVFFTVVIILLGTKLSDIYARTTATPDPSEVVIDEVAGMMVGALTFGALYAPLVMTNEMRYAPLLVMAPYYLFALFLLFRVFDVWKPWVIGWCDRTLKGGWGIMADDLLAGVFAGAALYGLVLAAYFSGVLAKVIAALYPYITVL